MNIEESKGKDPACPACGAKYEFVGPYSNVLVRAFNRTIRAISFTCDLWGLGGENSYSSLITFTVGLCSIRNLALRSILLTSNEH